MDINNPSTIILGAGGQLSNSLAKVLPNATILGLDSYDFTKKNNYDFSNCKLIINAAAYTNVDGAETQEGRSLAWQINATALKDLLQEIISVNPIVVHISSDYVFDGTKEGLYTEEDKLCPLGVYAQSKAAGDLVISSYTKHYILRTSWLIGEGKNFVNTMVSVAEKGINPSVVSDQIGRLSFTDELARVIIHLLNISAPFGIYNYSGEGVPASWADITRKIYEIKNFSNKVTNITTEEYFKGKAAAPRPLNSKLDLSKLKSTGFVPKNWEESLKEYLQ